MLENNDESNYLNGEDCIVEIVHSRVKREKQMNKTET